MALGIGRPGVVGVGGAAHSPHHETGVRIAPVLRLYGHRLGDVGIVCRSQAAHQEDVALPIQVAGDQVRRRGLEGQHITGGRDGRVSGGTVPLGNSGQLREAGRDPGFEVVQKDVHHTVGITRHQVAGHGGEDDVAPVDGDLRAVGAVVRFHTGWSDRDADRRSGINIVEEDIPIARITGRQLPGRRAE